VTDRPGGSVRPPPETQEQARTDRRVRALENPLDVRLRFDPRFVRLEVRNPAHDTRYDVVLPTYPEREGGFCTCTDFARRGIGTCKHLEAAWLWVAEHYPEIPPLPSEPSRSSEWAAIDQGLKAQARSRAPDPLRFRIGGAALLE
jgi:hypothetical protein